MPLSKNKSSNKLKTRVIFIVIVLCVLVSLIHIPNNNTSKVSQSSNQDVLKEPKNALNEPNGKPLLVTQHSNISNIFSPLSFPTNLSFTLVEGWISKNITIDYEGVASENNTVTNVKNNTVIN